MAIIRANFNSYEEGEEYLTRLDAESARNFKLLLSLLSSYWQSSIDGPSYAREIKAMAIALARIRLALEDVQLDQSYATTRTEFLHQMLTSSLFPNPEGAPDLEKTDVEFRTFLNEIVKIYFAGSVPASVQRAVELVTDGEVVVRENFREARKPGSGYDISDEFGLSVDVVLPSPGSIDVFLADRNVRIVLALVRPAHTLFSVKYVLKDSYLGRRTSSHKGKVSDSFQFVLSNYSYEDFRKFVEGVAGVDEGGFKKAVDVVGEDHTADF